MVRFIKFAEAKSLKFLPCLKAVGPKSSGQSSSDESKHVEPIKLSIIEFRMLFIVPVLLTAHSPGIGPASAYC